MDVFYINGCGCGDSFAANGLGQDSEPSQAVQGESFAVLSDMDQEPVTLDDFKLHCRVDFNTDDALLAFYLKAAREYLEAWSQLSFGVKTIRFRALRVPKKWKLVNGPYTDITVPATGFTLFDDILMEGGEMVDITLTTGWPGNLLPEAIKVAICRYGAGLYALRENLILNINGTIQEPIQVMDEAQKMVLPWANISWP